MSEAALIALIFPLAYVIGVGLAVACYFYSQAR